MDTDESRRRAYRSGSALGAMWQILKAVIDRVGDRQAHSMAIAQHSRIHLMFGWVQSACSMPPLDQSGV
jgi:hypothetical protein